jgi:HSP20 family molecular chaperone IbpA
MAKFLDRLTGGGKKKKAKKKALVKTSKKKKLVKKLKKIKNAKKSKHKKTRGQLGIDLWQTPEALILKSTIAGVSGDDLDISITSEMVEIKGKRESGSKISKDEYYYQECYWGAFSRKVELPIEIDADSAEATLKDGVLTIQMPKASKAQVKKLSIG